MSRPVFRTTSRRAMLQTAGTLTGAALALAAGRAALAQTASPAASPEASPAAASLASPAAGAWTFTDDRGVTVTLSKAPERVFADLSAAAPLWDFGIRPIAVAGWALSSQKAWGNVDRDTPVIADEAGELDIEALIALKPDLYVSITWDPSVPDDVWGLADAATVARVNAVAPIVCISATGMANANAERFAELAGLLGADLDGPELAAAREAYDASVAAFTATVTEKAELTSLFAYVGPEPDWYAASPVGWADLAWYRSLGMTIVETSPQEGTYWEQMSREQAVAYRSDVFFNSTRDGMYDAPQLQADPVFGQHPAIAAGQIGGWNQDFIMSYQGLTEALDAMRAVLETARKVV